MREVADEVIHLNTQVTNASVQGYDELRIIITYVEY